MRQPEFERDNRQDRHARHDQQNKPSMLPGVARVPSQCLRRPSRLCVSVLIAVGGLCAGPTIGWAQQTQPTPPADVHEHVEVAAPPLTPTREASGTLWLPDVVPMYGADRPWPLENCSLATCATCGRPEVWCLALAGQSR
jgi:hypothetical protein